MKILAPISILFSLIGVSIPLESVDAHGYISTPASRVVMCDLHRNWYPCNNIQQEAFWNKAGIEGPPGSTNLLSNPNFMVANGGNYSYGYGGLTQAGTWNSMFVNEGWLLIEWTLTAPHDTAGFRYFMTRQDWNPNAPLTTSSFDSVPFCTQPGFRGRMPVNYPQVAPTTSYEKHWCYVPRRRGNQVILGVWDNATGNNTSFFNVIDVTFP